MLQIGDKLTQNLRQYKYIVIIWAIKLIFENGEG